MLTEWRRRMLACITYRGWNGDITPLKLYRWQRPRYSYQARTFSSRRQPYMSRLLTGHLYAAFSSHARIVSCRKVRRTIPRLHFKLCTLKSRYQLACTSCTLFRPRTSPKGWDDGGRVFPDEYYFTCLLYESLFTWWHPILCRDSKVSPLPLRWVTGLCVFSSNLVLQGKAVTVQDRSGKYLTKEREKLNRWTEYSSELYNHKAIHQ